MAIPSRQIGWSGRANLLWQISKQLEYLTCVASCECNTTTTTTTAEPTTTTTTTAPVYFFDTDASSNESNYGACYESQGNPGLFSLSDTLGVGVQIYQEQELINPTPDGWYIYAGDVYVVTGGNGFITQLGTPCDAVLISRQFITSDLPCGSFCPYPFPYVNIWVTYNCNENWAEIGCRLYLDANGTTWMAAGVYNQCNGTCITVDANGYITNIS